MNHQFKPGDLALIIKCCNPANIGKCVELVELVAPGETYQAGKYVVENIGDEAVWHVVGDVFYTDVPVIPGHAQKVPRNLMPLLGDFQPERQQSREVPA